MHNAAFTSSRIDAVYLPLPAVDVDDFIGFARGIGLKGASVTIPYKVKLFERIDEGHALGVELDAFELGEHAVADGFGRDAGAVGHIENRSS